MHVCPIHFASFFFLIRHSLDLEEKQSYRPYCQTVNIRAEYISFSLKIQNFFPYSPKYVFNSLGMLHSKLKVFMNVATSFNKFQ